MLAGINHFVHPQPYMEIMPPVLPWHRALVYISGACEILGGLLVLFKQTRRVGAWIIILLLIAVFPANVQMALNFRAAHHPYLWVAILRLPLQALLIWWAALYTRRQHTQGLNQTPT